MRMFLPLIPQLAKLCIIGFALVVQGSSGHNASSSPAKFSMFPPKEVNPGTVEKRRDTSSTLSQPNGSDLHSPPALPPLMSDSMPETNERSNSMKSSTRNTDLPPSTIEEGVPFLAPSSPVVLPPFNAAPQKNEPVSKSPLLAPAAPAPVASPATNLPQNSPAILPFPSIKSSRNSPENSRVIYLIPSIKSSRNSPENSRVIYLTPVAPPLPGASPPFVYQRNSSNNQAPVLDATAPAPVAPQFRTSPQSPPPVRSSRVLSPIPSANEGNSSNNGAPVIEPIASAPVAAPWGNSPRNQRAIRSRGPMALPPSAPSPRPSARGPVISPTFLPRRMQRHHAHAPFLSVPPPRSDVASPVNTVSLVPSASPVTASRHTKIYPYVSPLTSHKVAPPPPVISFPPPPPPPNEDCSTTICTEPFTNTLPGLSCGCVLPMQVGLRLSVALYTFFPLVSELAKEIAAGVFMKQSQVRIIGATASELAEKTVVLIDLVPLGEKIDYTTAYLIYQRFWHKQVAIKTSLFGDYEVLYVRYLGLPPSPPLPPSDIGITDAGPYSGNGNNARAIKPLGVDVHGKHHKHVLSGGVIAIIVLSMVVAVVLCSAIAWVLFFKHWNHSGQQASTAKHPLISLSKSSGSGQSMIGSKISSTPLSFGSSIVAYTGSAKTFSAIDIEKATDNFDASRILGEGGFGRVYSGVLEDGTKVAVKVLKRGDQQGGREFLAEVEMLSRLHHRNLVKLIGICTEEHNHSLAYELIPNRSVESHLHGVDKESAPLDWDARIKIALGAARGLAYLHEDSSPHVIHRDFKSSNILLEHDFTPKVSDFGLARAAMDEEGRHISTRIMGTFGYVAPEYAMTGHLLVKSDVYSYGVVLLELLTGRKPVDMTQPPGQENLVAWARPLLASEEGLETIIDPSLGSDVPFDSVAKVAAIASMCVQPEVSHRPFMSEVVQALKLVCNECDEAKELGSRSSGQDASSIHLDARVGAGSGQFTDPFQSHCSVPNYDSGYDSESGLSLSDMLCSSPIFGRQSTGSFRRYCSSGPLRTGRSSRFWEKIQRLSRGSVSEHGVMIRFWRGSR